MSPTRLGVIPSQVLNETHADRFLLGESKEDGNIFVGRDYIRHHRKEKTEMTDEEILEEVYRRVVAIAQNGDANVPSQVRFKEFRDFIEREWQSRDELEAWRTEMFNLADDGQMYNITEHDK